MHACVPAPDSARYHGGRQTYVMEFLCAGRRFSCLLSKFQPRTQTLSAVVETVTDEKPVAAQWVRDGYTGAYPTPR
jgi:hypothetical protein